MAAPILWAPGILGLFLLENPHAHKIPPLRGGSWVFFGGGVEVPILFLWAWGLFPILSEPKMAEIANRLRFRIARARTLCRQSPRVSRWKNFVSRLAEFVDNFSWNFSRPLLLKIEGRKSAKFAPSFRHIFLPMLAKTFARISLSGLLGITKWPESPQKERNNPGPDVAARQRKLLQWQIAEIVCDFGAHGVY